MNPRVLGERLAIAIGRRERLMALLPRVSAVQKAALRANRRLSVAAVVAGSDSAETKKLLVPFANASKALGVEGFVLGIDGPEHHLEAKRIGDAIMDGPQGRVVHRRKGCPRQERPERMGTSRRADGSR